jgi:hypothetical protein
MAAQPPEVIIQLPDQAKAPAFRDSLRDRADLRVRDFAPGWVAVAPQEGAGAVTRYFDLQKVCDATTATTVSTWQAVADHPPYFADATLSGVSPSTRPSGPPDPQWRQKLAADAAKRLDPQRPETLLSWFGSMLLATPAKDVPAFLAANVPPLLSTYRDGSFWLMTTDELLPRRFAMLRSQFAIEFVPDVLDHNDPGGAGLPPLRSLGEHSLSNGSTFSPLINAALLTFSPSTVGYAFNYLPHSVVFLFGFAGSLLADYPQSAGTLFEPRLQSSFGFHWKDAAFCTGFAAAEIEALLQWSNASTSSTAIWSTRPITRMFSAATELSSRWRGF